MEIGLLTGIPLLTFLILIVLGKKFAPAAGIAGCIATGIGLLISLGVWGKNLKVEIPWVSLPGFELSVTAQTDFLNAFLLPLIHGIALLVQIYSLKYMKSDPAFHRYFAYLQLFVFSMLGIVLGGNLIVLYIFWELVGLSSYLLIGFWHSKPRTVWAAQKAFILNRIGDAAFLAGILLLIYHSGTVELSQIGRALPQLEGSTQTLIGLLLFGGCMGKSAQFPLSAWLPDAMEGPTPVSALIHAATMVAAGIFLMARIAFLLTPQAEIFIAAIGLITMVDGAIRACYAWDIKKVLAYSTQSQLGLMVFAIGLGAWQLAIFHLLTHAFFKAGLFLSAGSVIHAVTPAESSDFDPQDMRNMGGLKSKLPVTFVCYVICSAALAGLPLTSGFLSKDAIFLAVLGKTESWGVVSYLILTVSILSAALTAYYMTRQLRLIFWGEPRYDQQVVRPHESNLMMTIPMAILAFCSFFFLFSFNPFDATTGWLLKRLNVFILPHATLVPLITLALSVMAIMLAIKRVSVPAQKSVEEPVRLSLLRNFSEEQRYTHFFLKPFQYVASGLQLVEVHLVDAMVNLGGKLLVGLSQVAGWIDRKLVDGLVAGVAGTARQGGYLIKSLQNGKIQSYFMVTFISLILLIVWLAAGYL